jgi:DNA-binding transcriptional ArsR family regulator
LNIKIVIDKIGFTSYNHDMDYSKDTELLKALANETRLAILNNLEEDGCNVTKIVEKLNIPQSTISQNLGILRRCNIVKTQKIGYTSCYKVVDKRVKDILKILKSER